MLPVLLNEYHASRNGLKLLKSLPGILPGAEHASVAAARHLYPRAFGTYAALAAAMAGAPQVAKYFMHKHQES